MKAILFALFVALLLVGCENKQPIESEANKTRTELEESEFERTKRLAEGGDKIAQYNLGVMYENGRGVPQDYKEAVKWYTKCAEQGAADAQYNLGVMYANGREVPQGCGSGICMVQHRSS